MRLIRHLLALLLTASLAQAASSTTELYVPMCGISQGFQNSGFSGGTQAANKLHCLDFVPCLGVTNATQMAVRTGTTAISGGPNAFGVAIYTADGSSQIAIADFSLAAISTVYTKTGISAFSLTAGTEYRVCWCSNLATGSYSGNGMTSTVHATIANAFVSNAQAKTTACTTGVPPATALDADMTSVETDIVPPIMKLGTATP